MPAADVKGIDFPFRFGSKGHLVRASGGDKLLANLKALVTIRLRELIMEPDKGSAGFSRLFRNTSAPHMVILESLTREAIGKFEPRVQVRRVTIKTKRLPTGNAQFVQVWYRVKDTQQEGAFELRVGGDV
jgi:phage baseplate assembly protein W